MFLDDELYKTGSKIKPDLSNHIEIIKEMIDLCFEQSKIDLKRTPNDDYLLPVFKRINIAWNIAVDKLNKEGRRFVIKDGFLIFLINSEGFRILLPTIAKIIKL